jgi:hypothetical protein
MFAREFLIDLSEGGHSKAVLKLNERIFRFCLEDPDGKQILSAHGVDAFQSVLVDPGLPEGFKTIRYPQMVELLKRARERLAPAGG